MLVSFLVGKSIYHDGEIIITSPKMFLFFMVAALLIFAPPKNKDE
jgi:hypothetical protein